MLQTVPIMLHTDCEAICCSGFLRCENLTNVPPTDLSNAVHPIFAEQRFTDERINYSVLEQSLRLTSRLIEMSLPFFYTLFFAGVKACHSDTADVKGLEFNNLSQRLTISQAARTRDMLHSLCGVITFQVEDDDTYDGGRCMAVHDGESLHSDGLRGLRSVIFIGQRVYNEAVKVHHGTTPDAVYRLSIQFQVAVLLGHELAHSVVEAVHSKTPQHRFFLPTSQVAEEGYEWETFTFGGLISSSIPANSASLIPFYRIDGAPSAQENMFTIKQWPHPIITQYYLSNGLNLATRGELRSTFIKWNVDFLFIQNLFQTRWWDETVALHGIRALQPKLMTGYRFKLNPSTNEAEQRRPWDCFGDLTSAVPEGYVSTPGGLLMRASAPALATEQTLPFPWTEEVRGALATQETSTADLYVLFEDRIPQGRSAEFSRMVREVRKQLLKKCG